MAKAKTAPKPKRSAEARRKTERPPSTRKKPTAKQIAELSKPLPVTKALIAEKFSKPIGRPLEYQPEYVAVAYAHSASGGMDAGLAEKLGVAVATIYRWKNEYPDFCDALRKGKTGFDQEVQDALLDKAKGATINKQVPIKLKDIEYENGKKLSERERVELVTVTEQQAPDTGAMIFWLTNRQGDDWKNTQRRELTGADGAPIDNSINVTLNVGNDILQRLERMSSRLTIDNKVTDVEPQ